MRLSTAKYCYDVAIYESVILRESCSRPVEVQDPWKFGLNLAPIWMGVWQDHLLSKPMK